MRRWMTGALVGLVACGAPSGERADSAAAGDSAAGASGPPLATSLSVQVADDSVRFRLDIGNTTAAPLVIEFANAQRYDFAVEDGTGTELWRWSSERGFAQVLGADTIGAGETLTYEAVWGQGGRSGMFRAKAWLVSLTHPVELQTEFELPQE